MPHTRCDTEVAEPALPRLRPCDRLRLIPAALAIAGDAPPPGGFSALPICFLLLLLLLPIAVAMMVVGGVCGAFAPALVPR